MPTKQRKPRKSCKYGKLKRTVKTKSGRKRSCKRKPRTKNKKSKKKKSRRNKKSGKKSRKKHRVASKQDKKEMYNLFYDKYVRQRDRGSVVRKSKRLDKNKKDFERILGTSIKSSSDPNKYDRLLNKVINRLEQYKDESEVNIDNMPTEIAIKIINNINDVNTLRNLSQTSKFYNEIAKHRLNQIKQYLQQEIPGFINNSEMSQLDLFFNYIDECDIQKVNLILTYFPDYINKTDPRDVDRLAPDEIPMRPLDIAGMSRGLAGNDGYCEDLEQLLLQKGGRSIYVTQDHLI